MGMGTRFETAVAISGKVTCFGLQHETSAMPSSYTTSSSIVIKMADPTFPICQIPPERFVESCGAVLFDLSRPQTKKVCLVRFIERDEWYLAKGRRNCGESRKDAALREVVEETGHRCHLHSVTMATRAPPADEGEDVSDRARVYPNLTEPFMFTSRGTDGGEILKIIWWYIAALDEDSAAGALPGERAFKPEFFPCAEAVAKLTFPTDHEVLQRSIDLVEGSLQGK
ncbi:hypothetical protein K504DRAFT_459068 [Pleomassaria siparia CBS 279.74]|uniref:Nudix hydrolase domain-containing protein n=1 Tax=Pleomassaria siparia CBS 279.74 TaxID=1314801 RepID=A0A6G1K1B7_9PLEO|nr:hypothetical protein K504DRAFT_459068 [Pleomassaria siparia CBS 279.74]